MLSENYKRILENVNNAAAKCGKSLWDIHIVGVTKTVDITKIIEAIDLGISIVGENKVQEFLQKYDMLKETHVKSHIIGHLQTNKVKYIVDKVDMIQSIDSVKLLCEIDKHCKKIDKVMDCLIEINIGEEESKSGLLLNDCDLFFEQIKNLNNIRIKGLMSIPPKSSSEKELRSNFSKLSKIFIDNKNKKIDNVSMDILSMGMSKDYEYAILEGSNMVRIGTALFGDR